MRIRQDTPSLPYTTAASEFIYGYSSVLAALKANRRRLYALHVHTRGANRTGVGAILTKARALRMGIHEVEDDGLRAMDKASSGRPHNVSTIWFPKGIVTDNIRVWFSRRHRFPFLQ